MSQKFEIKCASLSRADLAFHDPAHEFAQGDIVIVGAGLAGLFTALRLAPRPVTVVSTAPLGNGAASLWAQGGIAAAVGEGDTPEQHALDTIAVGGGLVDEDVANAVAEDAPDRIRDLLAYGVPFDRDLAGHFVLSQEAAHRTKRVVRVSGDRAGAAVMQALIATVRKTPSIRVLEHYEAADLILDSGTASGSGPRVRGLKLIRAETRGGGTFKLLPARAVVLATGGIGALYAVTTNPATSRGSALGFAARAGAVIADAEFVQFHPTAIDVDVDPAPLASEALRGEGAFLVNADGHCFMSDLHEAGEMAPRDIVAAGVYAEIAAGRGAYLDCRDAIGKDFPQAFPTVYGHCRAAGIDPAKDLIPIAPAAHYHMGGIATDLRGRSSLEGLWAVGEVASTGLHGANRLASNSLLEAVVMGARVAQDLTDLTEPHSLGHDAKTYHTADRTPEDHKFRRVLMARLRRLMTENVGVLRDHNGLRTALDALDDIAEAGRGDTTMDNAAAAARLITATALQRQVSCGAHIRTDEPEWADGSVKQATRYVTLTDIDHPQEIGSTPTVQNECVLPELVH